MPVGRDQTCHFQNSAVVLSSPSLVGQLVELHFREEKTQLLKPDLLLQHPIKHWIKL